MKKIILYRHGARLLGSDQLMYIDGRFNLQSTIKAVQERNKRFYSNFSHYVADGFRYCDDRLNERGEIIKV